MRLQDLWAPAHRQWRLAALLLVVTAIVALLIALVYRSELAAGRFAWYAAAVGLIGLGMALVALLLQAHRQRTLRGLYEQVREELKASEQQYQAIFNASPTPLSLSQPDDGRFVDVNQAFLDQFGYSRAELIGRTSAEVGLFSTTARAGAVGGLQNARIEATEIAVHCQNGEIRDCLAAADELDLPSGRLLLIRTLDVTARKQAEDALRQSERACGLLSRIPTTRSGRSTAPTGWSSPMLPLATWPPGLAAQWLRAIRC